MNFTNFLTSRNLSIPSRNLAYRIENQFTMTIGLKIIYNTYIACFKPLGQRIQPIAALEG